MATAQTYRNLLESQRLGLDKNQAAIDAANSRVAALEMELASAKIVRDTAVAAREPLLIEYKGVLGIIRNLDDATVANERAAYDGGLK